MLLYVRVAPKSAKNAVLGIEVSADGKPYLKVRVTANPDKGKANKAVVDYLAKYFRFAKSNIQLVSGSASKFKSIGFRGDQQKLTDLLEKLQSHVDEVKSEA